MYSAMKVARYIIAHEKGCRRSVTNLRLQKLLYFVQAQFLVERNEPCFDAEIEAWDFGPVVPEVYHEYKFYGASPIPCSSPKDAIEQIHSSDRNSIDIILDDCRKYSTTTLINITHQQDPWKNARKNHNKVITTDAIKSFFAS